MKNIPKFLVIAILFLFGSGCATTTQKLNSAALKGDFESMENLAEQIIRESSNDNASDIFPLCVAYSKNKKYAKLVQCLNMLEKAIEKEGDIDRSKFMSKDYYYPLIPRIHLLRAEKLLDFGEYSNALKEAKLAYELGPKAVYNSQPAYLGNHIIYALGTLSVTYAMNGNRDDALKYINELDTLDISFMSWRHPLKYRELIKAYLALSDYKKAFDAMSIMSEKTSARKAIGKLIISPLMIAGGIVAPGGGQAFAAGMYGLLHPKAFDHRLIPENFMICKCQFENGHIEISKTCYDELLETQYISAFGDIYWEVLSDRGKIAEVESDTNKALDFYRKAVDAIESLRATINTEASRIGFVGNKQKVYHQMVAALYSDGQYTSAFEYVERSKSRALVDLLATKQDIVVSNEMYVQANTIIDSTSLLNELGKAELEEKTLNVSTPNENSTTDTDNATLPVQITQRTGRSVTIKEKIKNEIPELASLVTVSVSPVSEIQDNIGSDETLIEYYYHSDVLYAFILTNKELKSAKLDGNGLIEEIEDLRSKLQDPKSLRYIEQSQKAYQRLVRPIEHLIGTQKLVIVPHGILHYLPFSALNSGHNYLIDKYSISYLPSASVMKFLKQRKTQKTESALILGNPDLDDPKYDLNYAGEEAIAIAKEFSQAKVFLRKDATETNFKKTANKFNYIHVATHGIFKSDSPLNSGLFFSRDAENDGLLSVNELYSISLNADLVTLSACETALGKINAGDDVVGLQRGFLYAGANSIVASLWKVDDMATSQLMAWFYSNLKKTNKRDALREAQLATKKQYEHPYYWAAFQLTGMAN